MRYIELLSYLYNVYYRPERAMAFLSKDRRAIGLAHAMTLGALAFSWTIMWLVGRLFLPLDLRGMVTGWVLAWTLATAATVLCYFLLSAGGTYSIPLALTLAWTFCSLVVTPPIGLLLGIAYSSALTYLQQSPALILLMLLLCGTSIGNIVTIGLVLHRQRTSSALVRLMLTGATIGAGLVLWWSPPFRETTTALFAPVVLGIALGLSRPFSYLWEALLSLALVLVARRENGAERALAYSPICYDDLCLLPLPGLRSLLRQVCMAGVARGQAWLLRVSQHCGQGYVAYSTVTRIVREEEQAHALLLALSISQEGALFLGQQAQRSARLHPLIAAYAAFAALPTPGAWTGLIEQHRQALAQACTLPGGTSLSSLLLTGAAVLRADRWLAAMKAFDRHADADEEEELGKAVIALRAWALTLPLEVVEPEPILASLWTEVGALKGWPAALVAAIAEQLLFLRAIEHRRVSLGINSAEQESVC